MPRDYYTSARVGVPMYIIRFTTSTADILIQVPLHIYIIYLCAYTLAHDVHSYRHIILLCIHPTHWWIFPLAYTRTTGSYFHREISYEPRTTRANANRNNRHVIYTSQKQYIELPRSLFLENGYSHILCLIYIYITHTHTHTTIQYPNRNIMKYNVIYVYVYNRVPSSWSCNF